MSFSKLVLTDDERLTLTAWVNKASGEQRYVLRSKIILLLAEGNTYLQVKEKLKICEPTIAKWKLRFEAKRLDGLKDAPRSGKPRIYSEADRNRVIQLACEKAPYPYSNWSQRRIAAKLNISQSTVNKILQENELKPHKVEYWCGKSTDVNFEEKMLNIVGLYLNPPENAIVLSVDEKTQMQALDRSQPELPLQKGNARRQTATYTRHGTVSLIASLAVHTGEIIGQTMESNNADNFLSFLRKLDRKYTNVELHIIVDNLSVHKDKKIKEFITKKRKFHIHYTPTYSSWLNQIEIWFNIMSKDVLSGAIWKSKEQMAKQLIDYIKEYNKTAKPFCWTYDGTKIINQS